MIYVFSTEQNETKRRMNDRWDLQTNILQIIN